MATGLARGSSIRFEIAILQERTWLISDRRSHENQSVLRTPRGGNLHIDDRVGGAGMDIAELKVRHRRHSHHLC